MVRTLSGGEVSGNLTAHWDNRDSKGALVPDGTYTFKLTAPPPTVRDRRWRCRRR